MKILFIGDIIARAGRETVKKILPEVKAEYQPDLVIANAENIHHGHGFSPEHIEQMQKAGVDFFTTGNHAFGRKAGVEKMSDKNFPVIRPANYPDGVPGRGYQIIKVGRKKVLVVNLMGRIFMKHCLECPFKTMDRILEEVEDEKLSAVFVDFHAEATSEKYAFSFYVDGRVSAVVGTHTHVPTADARLLENGTAALSDVGMVGPLDSIIGVKKDAVIEAFLTQLSPKHEPETDGRMVFNSVLIEVDEKNLKALNIEHVQRYK